MPGGSTHPLPRLLWCNEDARPGDEASLPPEERPIAARSPLDDPAALVDLVRALVAIASQAVILSRAGLLVAEGDHGPLRVDAGAARRGAHRGQSHVGGGAATLSAARGQLMIDRALPGSGSPVLNGHDWPLIRPRSPAPLREQ